MTVSKARLDARRAEITKVMDDAEDAFEAKTRSEEERFRREQRSRASRLGMLEAFPEPNIGNGEMPYLLIVEYFRDSGMRDHRHLCGRTDRATDSQVWRLYNASMEERTENLSWIEMLDSLPMEARAIRIMRPQSYIELGRHSDYAGTVDSDAIPEWNGIGSRPVALLSSELPQRRSDGRFTSTTRSRSSR